MLSAVAHPAAFNFTGELGMARQRLFLVTAPALFHYDLTTGLTVASVAALHALVDSAGEQFFAGLATRRHLECARLLGLILATGTRPEQTLRTFTAGFSVTHFLALMEPARIRLQTLLFAAPLRLGTQYFSTLLFTLAQLDAGLAAGTARVLVADPFAEVLFTGH